jgi:hypothetical protein
MTKACLRAFQGVCGDLEVPIVFGSEYPTFELELRKDVVRVVRIAGGSRFG